MLLTCGSHHHEREEWPQCQALLAGEGLSEGPLWGMMGRPEVRGSEVLAVLEVWLCLLLRW